MDAYHLWKPVPTLKVTDSGNKNARRTRWLDQHTGINEKLRVNCGIKVSTIICAKTIENLLRKNHRTSSRFAPVSRIVLLHVRLDKVCRRKPRKVHVAKYDNRNTTGAQDLPRCCNLYTIRPNAGKPHPHFEILPLQLPAAGAHHIVRIDQQGPCKARRYTLQCCSSIFLDVCATSIS